jgi:nitrate/nitrite-specific signal transduction histidine kinase
MMAGRKDAVEGTIIGLGQNIGGQFDSIAVYDDQSVLTSFASGFPGGRDLSSASYQVDVTDPTCWACHYLPAGERPAMVVVEVEGQEVLRSATPLYNESRCQSCHGTGQAVLGNAIVDLRLDRFQQASRTIGLGLGGSIGVSLILLIGVLLQFSRRVVISPLENLVEASQAVSRGDFEMQVEVQSEDEIGQVGKAFNLMAEQVAGFVRTLEERVASRTQDLATRSSYLESSAEVSRTLASILDRSELIKRSVEVIRDTFDLYYVGLFLVDAKNEWAVLQAGTGEAGKNMLAKNHRLKIGEGMIGWCIANNQARIALDIGEDAVRFDNPDLPQTRSEGALPLRLRGRVLGALTVQSSEPGAFDQDILNTLQTMADQVSITLENAELLSRTEEALASERRIVGQLSEQEWQKLLRDRHIPKVKVTPDGNVQTVKFEQSEETIEALKAGQVLQEDGMTVILPLKSYGQIIGGIKLRKAANGEKWTQEQLDLVETLSERLSVALESARLFEESQRRAARERAIGEMTSKISASTDAEEILSAAVSELGRHLGRTEVILELGTITESHQEYTDE